MATRQTICGIGTHRLEGNGVEITETKYIKFIKLYNREYRSGWLICEKCVDRVKRAYRFKVKKAIALRYGNDVSSVKTTSSSSFESQDSIDRLVLKTPKNVNLTNHSKTQQISQREKSRTTDPALLSLLLVSPDTSSSQENFPGGNDVQQVDKAMTPNTVERSNRTTPGRVTNPTVADAQDNDEYQPSPNAVNGTRLPHVQPILKKRTVEVRDGFDYHFYHKNADIRGG